MFEARYWDGIELWWLPPGPGPSDIPYYGISCANGSLTVNAATNWQIVPADVLSLPPSAAPELPGAAAAPRLEPARPNPATDATVLTFVLRDPSVVEFSVLDAAGRRVASLASGPHAAGRHAVSWTGRDGAGRPLPSGVCFCCLEAEGGRTLRKVTLLHCGRESGRPRRTPVAVSSRYSPAGAPYSLFASPVHAAAAASIFARNLAGFPSNSSTHPPQQKRTRRVPCTWLYGSPISPSFSPLTGQRSIG